MQAHFFLSILLVGWAHVLCANDSSFFARLTTHYYFGQNLDLLNSLQPFDAYSLFQYIVDIGGTLTKELPTKKQPSLSLRGQLRIKGLFGNGGSSLSTTNSAIKIGWASTETFHTQSLDKSLIWLQELELALYFSETKKSYFKIGLFPFKIGNGLVLGNAYKIKIPIPGQYVYEQIDQFRPGLLLHGTNGCETLSAAAYLGIKSAHSTEFTENAAITNIQNLETPYVQWGCNKGSVLSVLQMNIVPPTTDSLTLSPYVLIESSTQTVEFPGDATTLLCTPGIYGMYEKGALRISFEGAKNFGHQHVKAWDRNQLIQANEILNTFLFYIPTANTPLATASNSDFTFSSIVISPAAIAQSYGNGNNFLYAPTPTTSFVFKNAYDRIRAGYDNTYAGFLAYIDLLITVQKFQWGIAFAYASGGETPNDTYDTLAMTRLTPNIPYKDYSKKFKGFVGIEQLFEGKSINPLYFAQAQKMNEPLTCSSQLTTPQFTNQGFLGTTFKYATAPYEAHTLSAQLTGVAYFMPTAVTKGVSATLWQLQSLDFTPQMLADMHTLLPRFLGSEVNVSIDYTIGTDLVFSVLGALFFPGSYYKKAAGKIIPLPLQMQLNTPNFSPDEGIPITLGDNTCFFISVALTCSFDSSDCKNFFKGIKNHV